MLGAFPWISQLKQLDIHFSTPSIDARGIFNFFASIFAMSIYVYMSQSLPYDIIHFPDWWIFIMVSLALCIMYLFIYIYTKDKVNEGKWRGFLFLNFIVYICLFCTLTTGFGLLKVYYGYYHFKGKVVVSETQEAVNGAYFSIRDSQSLTVNEFYSDENGIFQILIPKDKYESSKTFSVIMEGYKQKDIYIAKASFANQVRKIELYVDDEE